MCEDVGSKSGVKGLCRFFWEMESEEAKEKKEEDEEAKEKKEEEKRQTKKCKRDGSRENRDGGVRRKTEQSDEVQGRGRRGREGGSRV